MMQANEILLKRENLMLNKVFEKLKDKYYSKKHLKGRKRIIILRNYLSQFLFNLLVLKALIC